MASILVSPSTPSLGQDFTVSWSDFRYGETSPTLIMISFDGQEWLGVPFSTDGVEYFSTYDFGGGSHTVTVASIQEWNNYAVFESVTKSFTISVTYTACYPPATVFSENQYPLASSPVYIHWYGAYEGDNNPITGYKVYRATSATGTYSQLTTNTRDVTTTEQDGIFQVTSPATYGSSYFYKIKTIGTATGYNSALSDEYATVTSTLTTACTTPNEVSIDNQLPDVSTNVLLSWSGASGGNNNAISGYKIYRSSFVEGTYTALTSNTRDVTTPESSGSIYVTSPPSYGEPYYFKVRTIGSVYGYDSGNSTVYGTVVSTPTTACLPPTTISVNNNYPEPSSVSLLTWSGATAGSNNSIVGYSIYRDTVYNGQFSTLIAETDSTTLSVNVYSSPVEGESYYYRVKTKGSAGSTYYSPLSTVYAFVTSTKNEASCSAPTIVEISNESPEPLDQVTISWSNALGGISNAITGYDIYEDVSENGTFSTLTAHVSTSNTFGEYSITVESNYNVLKYYKIKTIGTISGYDSGLSSFVFYRTSLYADYSIAIPNLATLPTGIGYVVIYYDGTNVYKTVDNTVLDVVAKETILPCSGVYNDSGNHRYIIGAYSSEAYVNASSARALTESEQAFYISNGTTTTTTINKQWTGTTWTTTIASNNSSWSQAASSQITQTAENISLKVSKGAIISEINQSAEAISINASKINLNGVVTANENFKILSDGSMEAVNGKFGGDLTAEVTYCNDFELRSGKEMTVGLWKIGAGGIYYPSGQDFNYLAFLYHGETAYVTAQAPMYLGPDYTNPLFVSGNGVTFTITNNEYSAGFIQDYYVSGEEQIFYQEICLVCNQAGASYDTAKGNIGTQTHRWDVLWVDTAHYNTHPSDSSILVKHDIKNLRDIGDIIDKARPVEFKYNNDSADRTRFGLIYEELVKILPEVCRQDDKTGELGIEYDDFISILIKQAQESRKKEKELERRLYEQEEKVLKLEHRLKKIEEILGI